MTWHDCSTNCLLLIHDSRDLKLFYNSFSRFNKVKRNCNPLTKPESLINFSCKKLETDDADAVQCLGFFRVVFGLATTNHLGFLTQLLPRQSSQPFFGKNMHGPHTSISDSKLESIEEWWGNIMLLYDAANKLLSNNAIKSSWINFQQHLPLISPREWWMTMHNLRLLQMCLHYFCSNWKYISNTLKIHLSFYDTLFRQKLTLRLELKTNFENVFSHLFLLVQFVVFVK